MKRCEVCSNPRATQRLCGACRLCVKNCCNCQNRKSTNDFTIWNTPASSWYSKNLEKQESSKARKGKTESSEKS